MKLPSPEEGRIVAALMRKVEDSHANWWRDWKYADGSGLLSVGLALAPDGSLHYCEFESMSRRRGFVAWVLWREDSEFGEVARALLSQLPEAIK